MPNILNCQRDLEPKISGFWVPGGLKCLGSQFMKHSKHLGVHKDLTLWAYRKFSLLRCLSSIVGAFLYFFLNVSKYCLRLLRICSISFRCAEDFRRSTYIRQKKNQSVRMVCVMYYNNDFWFQQPAYHLHGKKPSVMKSSQAWFHILTLQKSSGFQCLDH